MHIFFTPCLLLLLGPFLSCKIWSYRAYFGPILGLIFAARNGPRTNSLLQKLVLGTSLYEIHVGPILITRSVLELLAFDQTCTNHYTTTPKLVGTSDSIVYYTTKICTYVTITMLLAVFTQVISTTNDTCRWYYTSDKYYNE